MVPSAESMRTRACRPHRYFFGSWVVARRVVSTWSEAALLPEFPGLQQTGGSSEPAIACDADTRVQPRV